MIQISIDTAMLSGLALLVTAAAQLIWALRRDPKDRDDSQNDPPSPPRPGNRRRKK